MATGADAAHSGAALAAESGAAEKAPSPAEIGTALPSAGASAAGAEYLRWRQRQFERIVDVGYRISAAAAPDCPGGNAAIGIVFDHPYQYGKAGRGLFGFGPDEALPRVIAVAEGSPADRAGIAVGDRLEIAPPADAANRATFAANEAAAASIDRMAETGGEMRLAVRHDGARRTVVLPRQPGCGGWFDMRQTNSMNASSNARWIQLTDGTAGRLEDAAGLAFVIGHEMAHRAMRRAPGHERDRCNSACEELADRMAMRFMMRAGYDPASALETIRRFARGGNLIDILEGRTIIVANRLAAMRKSLAALQAEAGQPAAARAAANGTDSAK